MRALDRCARPRPRCLGWRGGKKQGACQGDSNRVHAHRNDRKELSFRVQEVGTCRKALSGVRQGV